MLVTGGAPFDPRRELNCPNSQHRRRLGWSIAQWRDDGVAAASAASSDGGPTGGRGPPTVLFYFKSEGRGPDLRK